MLSHAAANAISAMTYLARQSRDHCSSAPEIASEAEIPLAYLSKLLGNLRRRGLIRATRGFHGGYSLKRKAKDISISEIVAAASGHAALQTCFLDRLKCNE